MAKAPHQSAAVHACREVTLLVLDRPRHEGLIAEARAAGARIRLISDGDVGGAIETAKLDGPVDIMMGIGGARLRLFGSTRALPMAARATHRTCAPHARQR